MTHLVGLGASVVVHGSSAGAARLGSEDVLFDIANVITQFHGAETLHAYGDLTQPDAVRAMVSQIHDRFGQIDILVNNARWRHRREGSAGAPGRKA